MIEEAREAWRGLMRVNPDYSIEHRRKVLPYKHPDDFEPFVEGLRKAGLPEALTLRARRTGNVTKPPGV